MNNRIKLVIEALEDLEINSQETRFEMARIIAIEELKKTLNGGWISVKEKLPERDLNCIITTKNGEILTSKFYGYGEECQGFKEFPEGVWEINTYGEDVVAWMPSPERYKEN